MSGKKVVDIAAYQKKKKRSGKTIGQSDKKPQSLDEKLKAFLHGPNGEFGSKEELIAIFEQEQEKKDREDQDPEDQDL